jgi:hypothetical protein
MGTAAHQFTGVWASGNVNVPVAPTPVSFNGIPFNLKSVQRDPLSDTTFIIKLTDQCDPADRSVFVSPQAVNAVWFEDLTRATDDTIVIVFNFDNIGFSVLCVRNRP